jgi:hypothetical protein
MFLAGFVEILEDAVQKAEAVPKDGRGSLVHSRTVRRSSIFCLAAKVLALS